MSQHDMNVANDTFPNVRSDLNNALAALVSQSSGNSAPGTTFSYQRWADADDGIVKRRNAANGGWILDGTLAETYLIARSSNTILGVANHLCAIIATSTFTQTLTAAATLGDGWSVGYRNAGTGVITLDPDGSEQINGATTLTLFPGDACIIYCNGSAFHAVLSRAAPMTAPVIAVGRNITASRPSASTVDIDADQLLLKDTSGNPYLATSVNLTLDITASGANGLDTGAEASGTWYYGWVIAKADGTTAGLLSTSATSPTMPTDYIYKALVTAARNDGSSNLINYVQKGLDVFFAAGQSILSGGTATSETNASTAAAAPSIAHSLELAWSAGHAATSGPVSFNLRHVSGANFFAGMVATSSSGGETQFDCGTLRFPYVANVAYLWGGSYASRALSLDVLGFRLPGGGQ